MEFNPRAKLNTSQIRDLRFVPSKHKRNYNKTRYRLEAARRKLERLEKKQKSRTQQPRTQQRWGY